MQIPLGYAKLKAQHIREAIPWVHLREGTPPCSNIFRSQALQRVGSDGLCYKIGSYRNERQLYYSYTSMLDVGENCDYIRR